MHSCSSLSSGHLHKREKLQHFRKPPITKDDGLSSKVLTAVPVQDKNFFIGRDFEWVFFSSTFFFLVAVVCVCVCVCVLFPENQLWLVKKYTKWVSEHLLLGSSLPDGNLM